MRGPLKEHCGRSTQQGRDEGCSQDKQAGNTLRKKGSKEQRGLCPRLSCANRRLRQGAPVEAEDRLRGGDRRGCASKSRSASVFMSGGRNPAWSQAEGKGQTERLGQQEGGQCPAQGDPNATGQ